MKAKKLVVIGLMGVLVLSVTLSALTFYARQPSPSSAIRSREQLNSVINAAVKQCIDSLPAGNPDCDAHLKDTVANVCAQDNGLDACHDGKVDQYYKARPQAK